MLGSESLAHQVILCQFMRELLRLLGLVTSSSRTVLLQTLLLLEPVSFAHLNTSANHLIAFLVTVEHKSHVFYYSTVIAP